MAESTPTNPQLDQALEQIRGIGLTFQQFGMLMLEVFQRELDKVGRNESRIGRLFKRYPNFSHNFHAAFQQSGLTVRRVTENGYVTHVMHNTPGREPIEIAGPNFDLDRHAGDLSGARKIIKDSGITTLELGELMLEALNAQLEEAGNDIDKLRVLLGSYPEMSRRFHGLTAAKNVKIQREDDDAAALNAYFEQGGERSATDVLAESELEG